MQKKRKKKLKGDKRHGNVRKTNEGEKRNRKNFFFLGVKGENNGSSYPGDCTLPTTKKGKQKKEKTKTKEQNAKTEKEAHTSEEQKTSRTFPLLFSMQCCFPLRGQVRTLQSS